MLKIRTNKEKISHLNNTLLELFKNNNSILKKCSYFYHNEERQNYIIYLYLYKLCVNSKSYLKDKYQKLKLSFTSSQEKDISTITNIEASDILSLLYQIRTILKTSFFYYDSSADLIYFQNNLYIKCSWFITFTTYLLCSPEDNKYHDILIYYAIPHKNIEHLTQSKDINTFISSFEFYNITINHDNECKLSKENSLLIVKNAAINYLKHLKQYKHGLESQDSSLIFYNLLTSECQKENFTFTEEKKNLSEISPEIIGNLNEIFTDSFYTLPLSKQVHTIENYVWKKSNDLTLLEFNNLCLEKYIDFLIKLKNTKYETFKEFQEKENINSLQNILVLTTTNFWLTWKYNYTFTDYSNLNFQNIKPKYMNIIGEQEEQELKNRLRYLNTSLITEKAEMDEYKKERQALNTQSLSKDKYQKELERCVSNINRTSIIIARLNSNLSSLNKEYEEYTKNQSQKYHNMDIHNYNRSIIIHICNAISGCSYYLKTNNHSAIFNNIIVFEDFEKTENSFYLEISFKDLLKISNQNILNSLLVQNDLPKLAS